MDHGALRTTLTRLARTAGLLLALLCAAYIAWRWQSLRASSAALQLAPARILFAALLYTVCCIPLALAWLAALRACGERALPASLAVIGYLQTQVAKYLPGGVLHYVARHAHGRRHGSAHLQLGGAAVLETLSLLLAASVFVLAGELPGDAHGLEWIHSLRWLPLAIALPALVVWVLLRRRRTFLTPAQVAFGSACVGLHLLFFALSTLACGLLIPALPPTLTLADLAAVLACAWLSGFVVIGAPGGLGVREAVLVTLLTPPLGESTALSLAVGYRLATMAGDIAVAGIASLIASGMSTRAGNG